METERTASYELLGDNFLLYIKRYIYVNMKFDNFFNLWYN